MCVNAVYEVQEDFFSEMRSYLAERIGTFYGDFQEGIRSLDNLSLLRDLNFQGNHLPDYQNQLIQQFYLLRYFPAYFIEYYHIYRQLLQVDFIHEPYRILSLGTGSGVDYCGLEFALREIDSSAAEAVKYIGYDQVNWGYRDTFGNADCYYERRDVSMLAPWETMTNILMFPMSIGEFDQESWSRIKAWFGQMVFTSQHIVLICTLRAERSCSEDIPRVAEIVDIMCQEHDFFTRNNADEYEVFPRNMDFADFCAGFYYPQHIRRAIGNLSTRQCQHKGCPYDCTCCKAEVRYWPIRYTNQACYQMIYLERRR